MDCTPYGRPSSGNPKESWKFSPADLCDKNRAAGPPLQAPHTLASRRLLVLVPAASFILTCYPDAGCALWCPIAPPALCLAAVGRVGTCAWAAKSMGAGQKNVSTFTEKRSFCQCGRHESIRFEVSPLAARVRLRSSAVGLGLAIAGPRIAQCRRPLHGNPVAEART